MIPLDPSNYIQQRPFHEINTALTSARDELKTKIQEKKDFLQQLEEHFIQCQVTDEKGIPIISQELKDSLGTWINEARRYLASDYFSEKAEGTKVDVNNRLSVLNTEWQDRKKEFYSTLNSSGLTVAYLAKYSSLLGEETTATIAAMLVCASHKL